MHNIILHVAVPTPLYKGFDYLPPQTYNADLRPGMRIKVPFGRTQLIGVLIDLKNHTEIDPRKLKQACSVLDDEPLLTSDVFKLLCWASSYYHYPIGEVFSTALPSLLRQAKPAELESEPIWRLTSSGLDINPEELKRAPQQQSLLMHLKSNPDGMDSRQLAVQSRSWHNLVKQLIKKGLVQRESKHNELAVNIPEHISLFKLNPEQKLAVDDISTILDKHQSWLLNGITGSGKTEVYLRLIDKVLALGKQSLVLVPEIGLTPQLVERFKKRFQARICVLHSGLTDRERLNTWLQARHGQADIVIGTRSAVFVPLKTPGIILIDEEHDNSLKQQDGFRYHARDIAVYRAKQLDIPIILGSATPSLESLNNVANGRYRSVQLTQRAGDANAPRITTLDMRHIRQLVSPVLIEHMRQQLDQQNQVLLFLNRRGYSPTLICYDCGWVSECKRCDAHMTYHKRRNKLICHHCGAEQTLFPACPDCHSGEINPLGSGTERIENFIQEYFPDKKILRIDRDTTRGKGKLEHSLSLANTGAANILIGTQMLAKGHHFPKVTLVGILDIDHGLYSADFRGFEYMAQLVIQVAGRAGRSILPGQVMIQTRQPEHALIQTLLKKGYQHFSQSALEERRCSSLPPYAYLAMLRAESVTKNHALDFLSVVREKLSTQSQMLVEILGPVPAPMERRAGRYRAQLLFQSQNRRDLHQLLLTLRQLLESLKQARQVRWSLDIDPTDML